MVLLFSVKISWINLLKYKIAVRTIPDISNIASGKSLITEFVELEIDDLLGRIPVEPFESLMKKNILNIVDGWTVKDCIGMWKGTEESSVEFTTVSDSLEDVEAVLDAVNYSAYQLVEESVMSKIDVQNWNFSDLVNS